MLPAAMSWFRQLVPVCACLAAWCMLLAAAAAPAWMAVPPGAGITVVTDSQDNQFCWYGGPADQSEWLLNKGGNAAIRIKGWQDVSALKFTLTAYRGQRVVAAELHLARANTDPVSALVAATINTDWQQGSACWRYRDAATRAEWAFDHSDFSAASFGNNGSLVCYGFASNNTFRCYTNGTTTWIALALDPALVYAQILDQYGLVVTDPRWHTSVGGNPTIYTREQNSSVQPRLHIQFAAGTDATPPGAAGGLAAAPGDEDGSVVLRFTAPSDTGDGQAFGYDIRYGMDGGLAGATRAARWRIPRPRPVGTPQRALLEGLAPGSNYTFYVLAYDTAGNTGTPASVALRLPPAAAAPALADGGLPTPTPAGRVVRTAGGVLSYFAAGETARINPITGNRIEDGYTGTGADDYKKANAVWDAAANTLALRGARNEVVGAQLVIARLGPSLSNVRVAVSDLTGPGGATILASPNIELFQLHYVASGASRYAEAAIPLAAPFPLTFAIPDSNHNAAGTNQTVALDLYIPRDAVPGEYAGTVTIGATELGAATATLGLRLRVAAIAIPERPTFVIDLNGYGNPWDFGPDQGATCLRYFQVCHRHRAVPNTLPYGWNGSVQSDRCPTLTGNGPTRLAASWSVFDSKYGPLFSSDPAVSAFGAARGYHGPGLNTPVTHFYTTFQEMWPQSMLDATYGFDVGGRGPSYWDILRASGAYAALFAGCPDIWTGFGNGYRQALRNVAADWFRHAASNGWTQTAFETYLNHKYTYNGTHALWALEECESADDFRAVGFFHQQWREGQAAAGATNMPWHFRLDISDRWGQNYGQLDNRVNWQVVGSGAAGWHWPSRRYRRYALDEALQESWIWYGLGAPVAGSGVANARAVLQKWCQGFDGGLPYWNSFNTQWDVADDNTPCVVYSGENVPGHGLYPGPIMSQRVKQLRQVQQIIELLNLWAGAPGMSRRLVRDALCARYGQGTWDHAFGTLGEIELHRLHADLLAQLDAVVQPTRIYLR